MQVKWTEILGIVMKGRFAGGHRGSPLMVLCLEIILGSPICDKEHLSLGGGRNEEKEVGGLSHCPSMTYPEVGARVLRRARQ